MLMFETLSYTYPYRKLNNGLSFIRDMDTRELSIVSRECCIVYLVQPPPPPLWLGLRNPLCLCLCQIFWCVQSYFQIILYTLSVKRSLSLLPRHSLNSKATKWIIFGHRLAIVLLTKHISRSKLLLESKRSKMLWNHKRSLFRSHRNCSPPTHRVRHGQTPVQRLHNPSVKLNE